MAYLLYLESQMQSSNIFRKWLRSYFFHIYTVSCFLQWIMEKLHHEIGLSFEVILLQIVLGGEFLINGIIFPLLVLKSGLMRILVMFINWIFQLSDSWNSLPGQLGLARSLSVLWATRTCFGFIHFIYCFCFLCHGFLGVFIASFHLYIFFS